jgi:hypothetical protein
VLYFTRPCSAVDFTKTSYEVMSMTYFANSGRFGNIDPCLSSWYYVVVLCNGMIVVLLVCMMVNGSKDQFM